MRWRIGTVARAPNDNRNASNRPPSVRPAAVSGNWIAKQERASVKPTPSQERARRRRLARHERHPQSPIARQVARRERAPVRKTWGLARKLVAPVYLRCHRVIRRAAMDRAVLKCPANDRARVPGDFLGMN